MRAVDLAGLRPRAEAQGSAASLSRERGAFAPVVCEASALEPVA